MDNIPCIYHVTIEGSDVANGKTVNSKCICCEPMLGAIAIAPFISAKAFM